MRPPYRALPALALAVAAVAAPALAVQEWYDYYLQARDRDIPDRRWSDCVKNLRKALQLRPTSGTNVRTYGLGFVDYTPHYYLGQCLLRQESYDEALNAFALAEQGGVIARTPLHAELARMRGEAQNAKATRLARAAREEVARLLRQARDLGHAGSWDDSLALLKQAEAIAKNLDAETLRTITGEQERQRTAQKEAANAAARKQRLEQRIADGQRLLQEGKATDALLAFKEALDLEPDPRAVEGRSAAEALILGSTTRENRKRKAAEGKQLFDAGQYEQAQGPLAEAALDPENREARLLLQRAAEIVKGLRVQKELRAEIERLAARGEGMMKAGRFPEAQVAFDSVLRLDSGHARARERLGEAEQRTGEAILQKFLPNQEPTLNVFEPAASVESATVSLQGVATDDRGIQKIEFRVGSRLVGEIVLPAPPAAPVRSQQFVRQLPLAAGPNEIVVVAVDSGGASHSQSFMVERRLRFFETPYFLPSALAGAVSLLGLVWSAQRVRRRRAVRQRFNPYIAGAPVLDDQMFYGRGKLTQRMLSTLHRNSLMITGERRIGKTTFLHHLKRALEEDEAGEWKFFPVFIDLQGVPERAFFHALMADVVEGLGLSGRTREMLRYRLEDDGYEARDFSHDLPLVLAELKDRTDKKARLALLIDEVDVLNEYSDSVNQRLRGVFMKSFSENLVAVMSGVAIRRRWHSEVSPWYNFFDEIELTPFTRDEAEALVREPVDGIFRFQAEAVDRILELSRLRPYLIQKYCVHAVNHMIEDGRSTIRREDVEAARGAVEAERPDAAARPEPASPAPVAD